MPYLAGKRVYQEEEKTEKLPEKHGAKCLECLNVQVLYNILDSTYKKPFSKRAGDGLGRGWWSNNTNVRISILMFLIIIYLKMGIGHKHFEGEGFE